MELVVGNFATVDSFSNSYFYHGIDIHVKTCVWAEMMIKKEIRWEGIEEKNRLLLERLPADQRKAVFEQEYCDIEPDFLGFIDIYESLSKLIPLHFTVVDLGCAYNPQCFYFTDHKKYAAVDISKCVKFQAPNCEIYNKSIQKFIEEDAHKFDLEETFAICSYVPPWGGDNGEMVRKAFKNIFVYYPHGGLSTVPKR